MNTAKEIKKLETDLLVDAIYKQYGYDFRHYQQSTIQNRFEKYREETGLNYISEMIPKILYDRKYFEGLFLNMSVTVTEMFRDPLLSKQIREVVIPQLKTYPYINVWHAGCATGEEVYSMAIMLKENEMLHRSQMYGTDVNYDSLEIAKKGIYPIHHMKSYSQNYNKSGGNYSLSEYYSSVYESAKIDSEIRKRITFAQHNLVTDGVFAEMHLIQSKNVLIYFNKELQNKVLRLFTNSLCPRGYLCLGNTESLEFTEVEDYYDVVDAKAKIYRKKIIEKI